MATIKISALTNIGNNLSSGTLLPVVSVVGNLTTDKVTLSNIANFVLDEAGNSFAQASIATLSETVVNAAQPNITSVGTLTSLQVSGNANLSYLNNLNLYSGSNNYFLKTDGLGNLSWSSNFTASTYANLPTPTIGARSFITDANIAASGNFGAMVSGNGSNLVPVYSNGTDWFIG